MARHVTRPRNDMIAAAASQATHDVADRIRAHRASQTPLRIAGAATWLDAGAPCFALERLDTATLRRVTHYEPGDLTLTVGAGCSLTDIDALTAEHGQWLTLDPFGAAQGTIGATVATGSSGPLASAFGTPRDHVLGCEFVTGAGDVVRAGGRVVKNVAGFDLVRLATGAWGTVGVITEVTVRLRARPEVERTFAVTVASDRTPAADAIWRWLRASPFTPLAAELLSPALASRLGLSNAPALLVRVGGNRLFASAAAEALGSLGDLAELDVSTWSTLRIAEPDGSAVFRASTLPSRVGELWSRVNAIAEQLGGYAHCTPVRGIVRCVIPSSSHDTVDPLLRAALATLRGTCTVVGERLPAELWSVIRESRDSDDLAQRVRRRFDPDGLLNPGVLGT